MTDPSKSAAADAAATAAAFGARSNYAKGWEDGVRSTDADEARLGHVLFLKDEAEKELAHLRTEGAKALEEATAALVAAESRIAVEVAGREVAEQRVVELRGLVSRMEAKAEAGWMGSDHACPECVGDAAPRHLDGWKCARHSVGPALGSTADIAGRWVSAALYDQMAHMLRTERDAAIARAETSDAAARVLCDDFTRVLRECADLKARAEKAEAIADRAAWSAQNAHDLLAAAERSRDEVGIQYAAAQAEIARMRHVVDLARASLVVTSDAGDSWDAKRDLHDALAALDTVPGDALAPTLKVESGPGFEIHRAIHATWAMNASERRIVDRLMAGEFVDDEKPAPKVFDEDLVRCAVALHEISGLDADGVVARMRPVPTSPAGASAQPTCDDTGRWRPIDTENPVSHLEALGVDTSNVKVCRCFTICCCDDNGKWSEEIASNVKGGE